MQTLYRLIQFRIPNKVWFTMKHIKVHTPKTLIFSRSLIYKKADNFPKIFPITMFGFKKIWGKMWKKENKEEN